MARLCKNPECDGEVFIREQFCSWVCRDEFREIQRERAEDLKPITFEEIEAVMSALENCEPLTLT